MRLLSSGPDDPMNGLMHDERPVFPTIAQPYVLPNHHEDPENAQGLNVLLLARRYWLLLLSYNVDIHILNARFVLKKSNYPFQLCGFILLQAKSSLYFRVVGDAGSLDI